MRLSTIFEKPVNRPIEGVIKADDEAMLRIEFEEYVLTNEVSKQLEKFLDAYNNYEGANGAWISGFFGSGKSHLLKILALLLENRLVDGKPALEIFLPKCIENEILRGDLKKAVSIPSKSILFNIDQKADVISKKQIDALLSVFVKVFDESCGYYGKQGHIAKFERDLDSRKLFDKFKTSYREVSGQSWESGREQSLLEASNIAQAYAAATGTAKDTALNILDKYRSEYKVSIEDFAEQVSKHIEKQGPQFRLNFFVDEVGQYIADNIKLMTNLQTIAESLATKCSGRAWVIVTAQEDMNAVIGEMTKQQGNDFSKIQARFANRLKLTSTDVDEVIQKRLLKKNDTGIERLSELYHHQSNNFKTLFNFADGSKTYSIYKNRDHFIQCYPFIPYQFTLFQSAIENLSHHNAFEGKHSSVGERSMLGVFQQVAVKISDDDSDQLPTFDLMFEGIRTSVKAQIQRSILQAEQHLGNPFALRVLKALFLVKYVKEFKSTIRNLSVLMLGKLDEDLSALRKQLEEALNFLEQQTYIQRNGDQYEFLTDEEKDVEEEIKNTDVESADVAEELSKMIFDGVIKSRKIRYDQNGQDYQFSKKLDGRLFGREHELAIHAISPFYEHSGNEEILRAQSMGRDELLVIMPADDRVMRDLLMYKRTEKYVAQNILITQQEALKRILTDKGFQNRERYLDLQQHVARLLGKSKLIIKGESLEIASEDAQSRLIQGFHELILRSYPHLRMLRGINYTENDISKCLEQSAQGLFGSDATTFTECEQEMLGFMQGNSRRSIRTTVKSLVENFERKPYGWYLAAILCTAAKLCGRGKLEARLDGNILEEAELDRALRNTQQHANLVLESQLEYTASQVRQLKDFYADFFDEPASSTDAKALGKETLTALQKLLASLAPVLAQKSSFPFLKVLEEPIKHIKELSTKPYTFFLTDFAQQREQMLDLKETTLDPIRRFMSGSMKDVYEEARRFLQAQEANFGDIPGDEPTRLHAILDNPTCFSGDLMQQAKSLMDGLKSSIAKRLQTEKTKASEAVQALQTRLSSMDDYSALSKEQQYELSGCFDQILHSLDRQTLIAVIRDQLRRFEEEEYQNLLTKVSNWSQPEPEPAAVGVVAEIALSKPKQRPERKIEYVATRSLQVTFDKAWLAEEQDVDKYLAALKAAIMKEIANGKRVQI
ncbi:MAG: hypothetical protein QG574_5244 [Cyanobacteriota bacterium erpe_2018_sw_21hr_WHONDRS-SW48-000092_B_bin.40]|jgi:hypothetical protein|nr:hypothetical protein [Cyanobacteriota bacterium erpe_2018_sw_21hr_WHONDRS-SW48-000092_B_bin.40]